MGQALYRTYRSKTLDEVIGQEHITSTLKNALKNNKISHAYLFTGPRGVGKTSIARILAHEINNFEYNESNAYLDIIEIDAASNRRIDEIRDLRDKVNIAPTNGKYKVYIIDEVHMLTKEAFNALLKTLEEPPAHVIFILATTEAHKLPETIISRTQRFTFKPIDSEKVVSHLKDIAKREKINIEDGALKLIADHGEGSFRDSISLLDQIRSLDGNKITENMVRVSIGIAPDVAIDSIIKALNTGNSMEILSILSELNTTGYQPAQIAKQISDKLRADIIQNQLSLDRGILLKLIKELIDVPASQNPALLLEIILLGPNIDAKQDSSVRNTNNRENKVHQTINETEERHSKKTLKSSSSDVRSDNLSIDTWVAAIDIVKSRHNTLYSVLRMAQPSIDGNKLTLTFQFPFHQKRIKEDKNLRIINRILSDLTSASFEINTVVDQNLKPVITEHVAATEKPNIEAISNIFGGAEMLES